MSDELNKNEIVQPEVVKDEGISVDVTDVTPAEVKEELGVEETPVEEAPVAEVVEEATEEDKKEATEEEVKEEDKVAEESVEEKAEDAEAEKAEDEEVKEEVHPEDCECDECKAKKEEAEAAKLAEEEAAKKEAEYDELKAKLADFEDEKEVREKAQDFISFKTKSEAEFDTFCGNLQIQVQAEFKRYGLDTSKTLGELPEAEKQIASEIINKAMALKENAAKLVADRVDAKYHELVFTKAEKLFNKFKMTPEQEEAAADTFIRIIKATGVADLSDDLKEKVKLSVASALMDKPILPVKEEPAVEAEDVQKVEEVLEEVEEVIEANNEVVDETGTEEAEVKEDEKVEEEEKEEPKADLSAFMDEVAESSVESGVVGISEDNVLEELAKLPFKERTAFYAANYDLIQRASAKAAARKKAK